MTTYNSRIYRVEEENSHQFYQMPKELFTNERYKGLTSDARVLYTMLLDRKELSRKNGWIDEYHQVYLIYTRKNIAELIGISERTAIKIFKQLSDAELISEERQGLNKPNRIYVWKINYSVGNSGSAEYSPQDMQNMLPSYTDVSETENNYNIKAKPLTVLSLHTLGKLKERYSHNTAVLLNTYAETYLEYMGKKHPPIKLEQLDSLADKLETLGMDLSLNNKDFTEIIAAYFFRGDVGDGNINRFLAGNANEGTIRGMMEL